MLILIVPFSLAVIWLAIAGRRGEIRRSLLESFLIVSSFIAVSTEILSIFRQINFLAVAVVWAIFAAVVFGALRRDMSRGWKVFRERFAEDAERPWLPFIATVVILVVTLILAILSPPNTYDSMTYHMTRVAYWIQSGTVSFYPTAIVRQLYQPPFSEYAILHLQILWGGDRFANLVQWFSLPLAGAAVSLITREFGGDRRTEWLSVMFAMTLPSVIVQGSSTQNDLLAAVFIISFFYFLKRAAGDEGTVRDFVFASLALGIAVLTKGTSYIFCLPVGMLFAAYGFFSRSGLRPRMNFALRIAAVVVFATVFSLGHYARNTQAFGSPVTTADEEVRTKRVTVRTIGANLARNYANHLGTFSVADRALLSVARYWLGAEIRNPDSTWLPDDFGFEPQYSLHEDRAGNPVHLLFMTLALAALVLLPAERRRALVPLAIAIVAGFFLFSVLLKWQMWGNRLQIPLFMLGGSLVALVFARRESRAVTYSAILLCWTALPFLFLSAPRWFVSPERKFALFESREKQFYRNLPDLEPYYAEIAGVIKRMPVRPEEIGIHIDFNEFEYPLWLLLKDDFTANPRIRHVGVTNASGRINPNRPPPEFVISSRSERTIDGAEYREIWAKFPFSILQKK